ncbi:MAG: TetR/AcrR family transcriptional regulator [Gammaproteobacteria bacterium]|nr:TetR/AcrR family transcriptional regulator [Gammaproteobacteria bacterium]
MGELNSNMKDSCRWRRRKEARPAEILLAALKVFSLKGFAATRLDEVAKSAGISKGTLYLYFDSKDALFKAVVVEFILPQIAKAEEQAEDYRGSVMELMLKLVDQWRCNVLETDISGIPKIMVAEASNFPELAQFYLENVIQRTRIFIEKLIQLGIERGEFRQCNPKHAVRTFLTPLVFSAIWKNSLAPFDEYYDINEYLKFTMDNFMRGIKKD